MGALLDALEAQLSLRPRVAPPIEPAGPRSEEKALLPLEAITALLAQLPEAAVLPAGDRVLARYQTCYFDDAARSRFHAHRRGRPRRHKIRLRRYLDRDLAALEIKRRDGRGRSQKLRRGRPCPEPLRLQPAERAWLADRGIDDSAPLTPHLVVDTLRLTLVRAGAHRLTIDCGLGFSTPQPAPDQSGTHDDGAPNPSVRLAGLAVVENKGPRPLLRRLGLRPIAASKYCLGTLLLHPALPAGRLAPLLRAVAPFR